jgi:hypothetical protein
VATLFIPFSAVVGIVFALILWKRVSEIRVGGGGAVRSENGREYLLEEEQRGESEVRGPALEAARGGARPPTHSPASISPPPAPARARRSRRSARICRPPSARAPSPSSSPSTSTSASSW